MTQPFNNEELNKGFQMDASLLSKEQLEHVEGIFKARGSRKCSDVNDGKYLVYDGKQNTFRHFPQKVDSLPFIDYPTLCRGAVQLEPKIDGCSPYAKFINETKRGDLLDYALSIGLNTVPNYHEDCLSLRWNGFTVEEVDISSCHMVKEISPEVFEQKLRGISPVAENSVAEKPRYYKSKNSGMVVKWIKDGIAPEFTGIVVDAGNGCYGVGYSCDDWVLSEFEPYDYERAEAIHSEVKEHMIAEASDRLGFEFEDSPATEHPKNEGLNSLSKEELIEEVLRLQDVAHGFISDLEKEWKENSGLRSKLLFIKHQPLFNRVRVSQLEQENKELGERLEKQAKALKEQHGTICSLKADNEKHIYLNNELKNDNQAYQDRISELILEVARLKGEKANEPKEPVYDDEWLKKILLEYRWGYGYFRNQVYLTSADGGVHLYISPKDSAPIIMAALAKELNGDWNGKGDYSVIGLAPSDKSYQIFHCVSTVHLYVGETKFRDYNTAQKAIDILTTHFPEVIKNYLA